MAVKPEYVWALFAQDHPTEVPMLRSIYGSAKAARAKARERNAGPSGLRWTVKRYQLMTDEWLEQLPAMWEAEARAHDGTD